LAWMSSDEVVVASLRAIPKKHYRVTPGLLYQIGWRLMQIPILHHGLKVYLNRSLK